MQQTSDYFYNYICGKLLGDGCITKQDKRKPRFQFSHRIEDLGWTSHCYELLKDSIPLNPPTYKKVIDTRIIKGYSESFVVQSKTSTIISQLYKLWYPNGKKKLPYTFLETYLDERALAWWYQDDGHLKNHNGITSKIILSTDSFSSEENTWLTQLLYKRFNLNFIRDGQNRLVLYNQFQIIYFLHLISLWLHESMNRKASFISPTRPIAKRTTIYLPTKFNLPRPTSMINNKLINLQTLIDIDTKKVCPNNIFKLFKPLLQSEEEQNSYQIIILPENRILLSKIRQQTGLTISKLTEYCFSIPK